MNKEMKQLMHQAKMTGCELFVGDTIRLLIYDKNGKVSKTYRYDHDESDYLARIKHHLDNVAKSLREMWGADFLELSPIAFSLELTVKVGAYSAFLIKTTEGEASEDEVVLLECSFNSEGLHTMSDYIANALLGEELNDADEKEEENIMDGITMTKELARVIMVMYYRMSPEEQQGIRDTGGAEVNQVISTAMKVSAEKTVMGK